MSIHKNAKSIGTHSIHIYTYVRLCTCMCVCVFICVAESHSLTECKCERALDTLHLTKFFKIKFFLNLHPLNLSVSTSQKRYRSLETCVCSAFTQMKQLYVHTTSAHAHGHAFTPHTHSTHLLYQSQLHTEPRPLPPGPLYVARF